MKAISDYLTLFTSAGTLLCCALPSLLVVLGAGSVMASIFANVPGIVLLTANKEYVFMFAGIMLSVGGYMQWRARYLPCPTDPELAKNCMRSRRISRGIYFVSLTLFLIGGFFAYILADLLY